jgi:hypothetical protein
MTVGDALNDPGWRGISFRMLLFVLSPVLLLVVLVLAVLMPWGVETDRMEDY